MKFIPIIFMQSRNLVEEAGIDAIDGVIGERGNGGNVMFGSFGSFGRAVLFDLFPFRIACRRKSICVFNTIAEE